MTPDIEAMPMTVGITIAAIFGISFIVGFVWTIATIRSNDRADISKDIGDAKDSLQNGLNRFEITVNKNHDVLHGRVNKQMEEDGDLREKFGHLKGVQETHEKFLLKMMDHIIKN